MENSTPSPISEIQMEDNWMTEMIKKFDSDKDGEMWMAEERPPRGDTRRSIYKVPKVLKDVNGDAYIPKLVSLGPYHHGRPHLRPMEQHKARAFVDYMHYITVAPEEVLIAMRNVKDVLIGAYGGLDNNLDEEDAAEPWLTDEEKFLRIMIVDGCFVLHLLQYEMQVAQRYADYFNRDLTKRLYPGWKEFFALRRLFDVPKSKDIFADYFKRDLLLTENQLPLLALYTLAGFEREKIFLRLDNIIADFFKVPLPENINNTEERSYLHILDLYRKCRIAHGNYLPSFQENLRSATELSYAGISFCPSRTPSLRDISIVGGVLQLPVLEIDDGTENLLLNLMSFELMHSSPEHRDICAYAFFMKNIIYTSEDVALLRKKCVIKGWLGNDDMIVNMFKHIIKEHTPVHRLMYLLDDVDEELNYYCTRVLNKFRANFMRAFWKDLIYFGTFWLGVVIIFVLTLIQTIFAVLSYKQSLICR